MIKNIAYIILVLLALNWGARELERRYMDRAHEPLQEGTSQVSPNSQAATASLLERLRSGVLCIGLMLYLAMLNYSFFSNPPTRIDEAGNPDSTILYADVMILIAINLSGALMCGIAFGICIGKLAYPPKNSIDRFVVSSRKINRYSLY